MVKHDRSQVAVIPAKAGNQKSAIENSSPQFMEKIRFLSEWFCRRLCRFDTTIPGLLHTCHRINQERFLLATEMRFSEKDA